MADLPLNRSTRFGLSTSFPYPEAARATMELVETYGLDSVWVGDHIEFQTPILDPIVQLSLACAYPSSAQLGTGVYLLPLRHPTGVAKQVATLDRISNGRLIFGVGIGGEFPNEFAAVGVPVSERGARLTEGIEVLRKLWADVPAEHHGRFYDFPAVHLRPGPLRPGGPPIICGGRSDAALGRIGRLADGWMAYLVSPERYAAGLVTIAEAAEKAGRTFSAFESAHVLFAWMDDDVDAAFTYASDALTARYGMDFTSATRRYAAFGRPSDIAEKIAAFHRAGVRHFAIDWLTTDARRDEQIQRFAEEVKPLIEHLD